MQDTLRSFKSFVAFVREKRRREPEEGRRTRYAPAPERGTRFEDEETYTAELCIRVFERVMHWIGEDEELGRSRYFDIFAAYSDILQDELKDYAFELAYHLYSLDPIVVKERRERVAMEGKA